jgi:Fe-S-cluster containining protein
MGNLSMRPPSARSLLLAQYPDLAGAVDNTEAGACDQIVNDLGCTTKDEARAAAVRDPAAAARVIEGILDSMHALVVTHPNHEKHEAACRPGCSACCWIVPDVTQGDAERIATALQEKKPEERADIAARAREAAAAVRRAGGSAAAFPLRCPLLGDDNLCHVYADRPLSCRAHASRDAAACLHARDTPDGDHSVPVTLEAMFGMITLDAAFNMLGFPPSLPLPIVLQEMLHQGVA